MRRSRSASRDLTVDSPGVSDSRVAAPALAPPDRTLRSQGALVKPCQALAMRVKDRSAVSALSLAASSKPRSALIRVSRKKSAVTLPWVTI
jgi:hypothetical protein